MHTKRERQARINKAKEEGKERDRQTDRQRQTDKHREGGKRGRGKQTEREGGKGIGRKTDDRQHKSHCCCTVLLHCSRHHDIIQLAPLCLSLSKRLLHHLSSGPSAPTAVPAEVSRGPCMEKRISHPVAAAPAADDDYVDNDADVDADVNAIVQTGGPRDSR